MKKFMRTCAIAALILIGVGAALSTAAGAIRGRRLSVNEILQYVDRDGNIRDIEELQKWGLSAGGNLLDELDKAHYDVNESSLFDNDFAILSGDVENYSLGSGIKNLSVEVGGCKVVFQTSADEEFHVEAVNAGKLQCYVEKETLYLKSLQQGNWNHHVDFDLNEVSKSKVILYIPVDCSFEDVDVEIGAGILEISNFQADKMELEVGAGQILGKDIQADEAELTIGMGEIGLTRMQVRKLSAETGMGNLEFGGDISEKAELSCSMGNITMVVDGAEQDFNYDIEMAAGNVIIGGSEFSGLAKDKKINNGAIKEMELECSMGNIEVLFE